MNKYTGDIIKYAISIAGLDAVRDIIYKGGLNEELGMVYLVNSRQKWFREYLIIKLLKISKINIGGK